MIQEQESIETSPSTPPSHSQKRVKKQYGGFRLWQLILPVGISLFVIYLMKDQFTPEAFKELTFEPRMILGIFLALVAWGVQNVAMAYRYYTLADKRMSIWGALRVTLLADFASAVTPSAVGGSSVVFLFLSKEGVSGGRATAMTISGLFLDESFMATLSIFLLILLKQGLEISNVPALSVGLNITLIVLAVVLTLWTLALYISLFHKSSWVGNILLWITSWKPLRKFRKSAEKVKQDIQITSQEMIHKDWKYWIKLYGATIVSWVGRFCIACMLVYGFCNVPFNLWVAFIHQIAIWILAIIIPTPGGSGFAEYMFQVAYIDFFASPAIALIVALMWRAITSFSYLFIGPAVLMYQLRNKKPVIE